MNKVIYNAAKLWVENTLLEGKYRFCKTYVDVFALLIDKDNEHCDTIVYCFLKEHIYNGERANVHVVGQYIYYKMHVIDDSVEFDQCDCINVNSLNRFKFKTNARVKGPIEMWEAIYPKIKGSLHKVDEVIRAEEHIYTLIGNELMISDPYDINKFINVYINVETGKRRLDTID